MLEDSVHDLVGLVSRQVTDEEGDSPALIKVFISFQLFGLFGTILMLVTALCPRSKPRQSTWYSFTISWIISTVSYTLLFWGGALTGPEPPYTLCLIQGILVYSAPPMTAATTLALVIQIWILVRSVVAAPSSKVGRVNPMFLAALLVFPYVLYVSILVGTFVVGWQNQRTVRRVGTGMYCNFSDVIIGRATTFIMIVIMVPAVVFEVLVCRALHKQWILLKRQSDALSAVLRVASFTFMGLLGIALSILFFFMIHHGSDLNIVISIMPIAVVLIFGTQGDLLRVWMFWKKPPQLVVVSDKMLELTTSESPRSIDVVDISA